MFEIIKYKFFNLYNTLSYQTKQKWKCAIDKMPRCINGCFAWENSVKSLIIKMQKEDNRDLSKYAVKAIDRK